MSLLCSCGGFLWCGLSDRWFLLWSYFCFHFLSAITFGNHERELTCHSQSKLWGLHRVECLFPVWVAGVLTKGETKSWSCLWGASLPATPRPPSPQLRELCSVVPAPGALLLPSSQLMVLFCLPFLLSPEAFYQLPLHLLLSNNSPNLSVISTVQRVLLLEMTEGSPGPPFSHMKKLRPREAEWLV